MATPEDVDKIISDIKGELTNIGNNVRAVAEDWQQKIAGGASPRIHAVSGPARIAIERAVKAIEAMQKKTDNGDIRDALQTMRDGLVQFEAKISKPEGGFTSPQMLSNQWTAKVNTLSGEYGLERLNRIKARLAA